MSNAPDARNERTQVLNLIDYLAAYNAQCSPAVRDIAEHRLYRLPDSDLPDHPAVRLHPDDATWLTVDFVELPATPTVPEGIADMLTATRLSPDHEPELVASPTFSTDSEDREEGALRAPERELEWDARINSVRAWIESVWVPWSRNFRRDAIVKRLHRDLFEQRERLITDRDSVELVWGFGLLRWQSADGRIDHPLVSVPVEIDITAGTEQISVRPTGAVEVESRFLQGVDIFDRAGHTAIRQAVVSEGLDPWSEAGLADITTRLVRAIDDEGVVVGGRTSPDVHATADDGWLLFLRRRVPDSQGFLDAMRSLYAEDDKAVPEPLRSIITSPRLDGEVSWRDDSGADRPGRAGSTDPLLLPLSTNEQQQQILRSAQRCAGVTVQGPPGTGKSHTIANLISHYVAYGQRVLVVAEKEQALKVLADKIPEGIRDLTVSVLGADDEGRKRLESAILKIQVGVTGVDRIHADSRIAELTGELDVIDRRIVATTTTMLRARVAETETLPGAWAAGADPTPQSAAQWVARNQERLGYIPDEIHPGQALPISSAELLELCDLIDTVGLERAELAGLVLPTASELPDAEKLAALLDRRKDLKEVVERAQQSATNWDLTTSSSIEALQELMGDLSTEREWLQKANSSWKSRLLVQLTEPEVLAHWQQLQSDITDMRREALAARTELDKHHVQVPTEQAPDFAENLTTARSRLATKGKLGVFSGDAKRALEQCRVDGRVPSTASEVELCLLSLRLSELRTSLMVRWHNQGGRVGAPPLSGMPEETSGLALADLTGVLEAQPRWRDLDLALGRVGGRKLSPIPTVEDVESRRRWCADAIARFEYEDVRAQLNGLDQRLREGSRQEFASPLWAQLQDSLRRQNVERWKQLMDQVAELFDLATSALRLRSLRDTLTTSAPLWTREILTDPRNSRDAGDLLQAWQWRQLNTWIRTIAAAPEPGMLQAQLQRLTVARRRTVTELVAERAWRRLADNLGPRQRQALQSYVQAVRKYGKTGGKYAQRWINLMRTALDDSKDAVPVWIMSTSRALSSFTPSRVAPFDVLIIDEASQIGFEALPLLSLAKSAIVVGDDKQTSPENVGLDRQRVFDLMGDYLRDVPNYQVLFDPDNSLYDLAIQKFSEPIMLTEHFRCLPEIIAFSNKQAYDNLMVPLRDRPPAPGWTPLGLIRVRDGYRTGDLNDPEAVQVADLVAGMCRQSEYDGMTFGVISLLGTTQSKRIWDLLYDRLGPEELARRKIRCGESANFQGDERDVMVISTVVALDPSNPSGRIRGAMTSVKDLRRINVAASRAKNQMWVVTSVDPDMLPPRDLRADLIRHCKDPGTARTMRDRLADACESDFELSVLSDLLSRGYRSVLTQHQVGRYRMDFVVEGPESRLAIECDGDRWHGEDRWHSDRARQQVLERAGWTFERIRGSSYYRDPARAMEPVWARLEELGIPTGDEWMVTTLRSTVREVSGAVHSADDEQSTFTGGQQPDQVPANPGNGARPLVVDPAPSRLVEMTPPRVDTFGTTGSPSSRLTTANGYSVVDNSVHPRASAPVRPDGANSLVFGFSPSPTATPRAEVVVPQTAERPEATVGPGDCRLETYRSWTTRALPSVAVSSEREMIAALTEIVGEEGPMHGAAAFEAYVAATGGRRVGTQIRRTLAAAASTALQRGELCAIKDQFSVLPHQTLYVPGQQPVRLRTLGTRTLRDVPRSEISTLIERLGVADHQDAEMVKRAVLARLGLKKLTTAASDYLDECLRYTWQPRS